MAGERDVAGVNTPGRVPGIAHPSPFDPETEFRIVTSDSPPTVDGVPLGAPTGEVRCIECGRGALNINEIPHTQDCPQRFVRSRWWASAFTGQ